eukprot:4300587-Alexandrium_andersonii.AAC.1
MPRWRTQSSQVETRSRALSAASAARWRCASCREGMSAKPQARASARTALWRAERKKRPKGERGRLRPLLAASC